MKEKMIRLLRNWKRGNVVPRRLAKLLRKLHRELWKWLMDNPTKRKWDWPRWESNGGDIPDAYNFCFACHCYLCDDCPCDWGPGGGCMSPPSPYMDWRNILSDEDPEKRKGYAKLVRNSWKK